MATMHLDDTVQHYHIRECGNRARVVVTKTPHNTYVCYERLVDTGEASEGQTVSRWTFVPGTATGMGNRDPMPLAQRMYDEGPARFGDGKGARIALTTDLQAYEAMLQRASMERSKSEYRPGPHAPFGGQTLTQISVEQSHHKMGYIGFTANHFFNQDGALVAVGGYQS